MKKVGNKVNDANENDISNLLTETSLAAFTVREDLVRQQSGVAYPNKRALGLIHNFKDFSNRSWY